jgi:hypothetical protein
MPIQLFQLQFFGKKKKNNNNKKTGLFENRKEELYVHVRTPKSITVFICLLTKY